MASAKFEGGKCKGSAKAKAFLMHDEKEQRLEHEHTNEHIDKAKTHMNTSAYGLSYEEACEKYDKRIAELDATTNTNKRKDRVTMQSIEIPVPKGLPHDKHQEFFDNVKDILCEMYGEENLVEAYYHFDEEHEYTDPVTKQKEMSRNHGHYNFVPECEGQLNGKWFSSRANMKKLNGAIDRMAQKEFGMSFMDGSRKKGKKSVEQLKNESKEAELVQQMQDRVDRDKQRVLNANRRLIEIEADQLQQQYDMENMAYMQQQREDGLNEREQAVGQREQAVAQKELEVSATDTAKLQRAYAVAKTIKFPDGKTVYDEIQRQEKIHQENIQLLLQSPSIRGRSKSHDYDFDI